MLLPSAQWCQRGRLSPVKSATRVAAPKQSFADIDDWISNVNASAILSSTIGTISPISRLTDAAVPQEEQIRAGQRKGQSMGAVRADF